jgi:hypothetical protein
MPNPLRIFARPRQPQPFDETLPDGTPAMMLGIPANQRPSIQPRGAEMMPYDEESAPQPLQSAKSPLSLVPNIGPRPAEPANPAVGTPGMSDPGIDPMGDMQSQAYSAQTDPTATASDGRLMTPAEQRLNEAMDSYSEAINRRPVDKNGRGKSILQGMAFGASKMGDRPVRDWGDFAQQAGSAIGGGVGGAIHPAFDEELDQRRDIGERGQYLKAAQQNANIESNVDYRRSTSQTRAGQLDLNREKEENRKIYQQEKINLGQTVADNNMKYRNQILELRARGLDQGDERIQALQSKIDENVRHNKVTEGQTDKKIKISLKMADLADRRTTAYEEHLKKNPKDTAGAKAAQDQAESKFWSDTADEYEQKAKELEASNDPDNAEKMRTRAITARERSGRLGARSNATPTPAEPAPAAPTQPATTRRRHIW